MKFRRIIAVYSVIVGIAMLGIWIMQLLTGQAPELEIAPIEIALAITADCLTAFMLIISGAGLLAKRYGLTSYICSHLVCLFIRW